MIFLLVDLFVAINLIADNFPNFGFLASQSNAENFDKKSGVESMRKLKGLIKNCLTHWCATGNSIFIKNFHLNSKVSENQ
jgi:hypothetical protein